MRVTAKTIGERIRQAREEREMRPERVAAELEISTDTLSRFEAGKSDPSALQVWMIAKLTEKPFSWFATDGEPASKEELDRAILAHLLDDLDAHDRRYRETVAELRRLLGQ